MRILHVIPAISSGSGGPSRSLVEMCRATVLANPSVEIDIATTSHGLTDDWHEYIRRSLPGGTTLHVFPQVGTHTTSVSIPLIWWVWRNARRFDVLHIHALFHPISSAVAAVAYLRGVPYVLRPLGTLSPYTFAHRRTRLKEAYFKLVDSHLIKRAAALHFTAPQEAAKASRLKLNVPVAIVPHPYAGASVGRREEREGLVLFLARLHPGKGLNILLPAFSQVARAHPSARLVIAGSGSAEFEAQLRTSVREHGLESLTTFAGFVDGDAKSALLRTAAVFVLPSYQENFGMSVVEAMSAGIPVVVSDQVDLWPDVAEYGAGHVTPLDAREVADAISAMLASGVERSSRGDAGRRLVAERYSPAVVGDALNAMYAQAVATSVSPV